MIWTTTLALCRSASEDARELRAALQQEGRRCSEWSPGDSVADLTNADLVLVLPEFAAAKAAPFARSKTNAPIVIALAAGACNWADAVLSPHLPAKLVADRVTALLRLVVLDRESELRSACLTVVGAQSLDERGLKPPARMRALHIGGPSKEFGALQEHLAADEIDLRPILRPSLALDEIENGLVDAILLDSSVSPQETRELGLLLRRNSDLTLVPVVILDPKSTYTGRAPSLLSDVVRGNPDGAIISARISQLVGESRRRRRALTLLQRARTKDVFDAHTGLATARFFDTHIETHIAASAKSGRALTAGLVRIQPRSSLRPAEAQSMQEQIAHLIARLIRSEDLVSRLDEETLALLFPATIEVAAQAALKRIAAVLAATRFHANRYVEGVTVGVDWSVVTPQAGQTMGSWSPTLQAAVQAK